MNDETMSKRLSVARLICSLLFKHGFYQSSDGTRVPEKIDGKHPIHRAIEAYRETYSLRRLPVRLSQHIRPLLRYSRRKDPAAFDMAELILEDLQEMHGAIQELPLEDGP